MASPTPERLEMGREPRPRDPRRVAAAAALAVVLVTALAVGLVVDNRLRDRESARVDACVTAAQGAVSFSAARVTAILGYVRPTLVQSRSDAGLRRRLLRVVSAAVEPTIGEVRRAREQCERTRVLALHTELRAKRADCLRLLDADLAYLRSVVTDGANALRSQPLPTGTCDPPEPPS